jgi:predicted metalloprotease
MVAGGGIVTVIAAVVVFLLGGDPTALFDGGQGRRADVATAPLSPEQQRLADFVSVVLADTEDVWTDLFQKAGKTYQAPRLVIFSGRVESACGLASAAVGPFYCPADGQLYIDLAFFDELKSRFRAPGDFAQAYVIAHEVGHHVQNLLGATDRAERGLRGERQARTNEHSVRVELQADFFAGVWAHHAQKVRQVLEPGDIDEALNAATAIGDDRLQHEATGHVVPDSFTHGTSAQRRAWFRRGFESGDMTHGDTFDDRLFEEVGRR